jgi:uncharacterized protein (TIGR02147 family)
MEHDPPMKKDIYSYRHYKELINDLIGLEGRGTRRRLAQFCKCQESYISSILNGSNEFSLEQAERACEYFKMNEVESEYFLLLCQENRAGTKTLKAKLSKMLNDIRIKESRLSKKLEMKSELSAEDILTYYSHWSFSAIHMILLIPDFQDALTIAQKLGLSEHEVRNVLQFLQKVGLISKTLVGFASNRNFIHLDKGSPLISQLHTNWRIKAIDSIRIDHESDLHYSGVMTMSEKTFEQLRSILSDAIKESIQQVKSSRDERLVVLGVDLFSL